MDSENGTPITKDRTRKSARNWFLAMSSSRRKKNGYNEEFEATNTVSDGDLQSKDKKLRRDDRSLFQRMKKKFEMQLSSRQKKSPSLLSPVDIPEQSDDDFKEFVDKSKENTPLTHYYHNYITKKWLGQDAGPNLVMFKACSEMTSHVWYWGEISRHDAQRQLTDKPNGSFLVRDSETSGSQFTLSFRIGNWTLHYRLQYRDNYWHFEELQYESIVEMIEDIMHRSTDEHFVCYVKVPSEMQPPFPVILKYPMSRYLKMPTLQDMCRCAIQRYIAPGEIEKLPIPRKLQQYLHENNTLIF